MIDFIQYIYDIKVVLFLVGIYLIYKFGKLRHNLHLKLGHKGPPPLPYVGNFYDMYKYGVHEFDKMCLQKYGKIYPIYMGNIKMSSISDEEVLRQILVKDAKCFTDRLDLGVTGESTKMNVGNLKGKDWERVRSLMTPAFTSGKLKKMSPLISGCVDVMANRISQFPDDQPLDFKEFLSALTMDVIARTMFGIQIDSQTDPNNAFLAHGKTISSTTLNIIFPELKNIFRLLMPKWEFFGGRDTVEFFSKVLKKAIEERQKSSAENYSDFLALMLSAQRETNEDNSDDKLDFKSLSVEEVKAQALIFLLAGFETTAMTLTFAAYFLAKNPMDQQEIYNEILDSIGSEGEITYESISNMPLLDAVLNETLRLCPPLVRTERICTQDITLVTSEGKKIFAKKGDAFTIPIYAIHTDPSRWTNPDVFDFHRFDSTNINSLYSFMPFGIGPRNCIGMRFALLESKWALANIIQKFEIVPCAETMETITFQKTILSSPTTPIILKIKRRE